MKIDNLKIIGDKTKSASDKLNDIIKEKLNEIKITVPFEANGKFEKQPLNIDGTPVEVKPAKFEPIIEEEKVKAIKTAKSKKKVKK